MYDIPVVLFFMKRTEMTVQVIRRIKEVQPRKLYLISDGGRNDLEKNQVKECREAVEKEITWQCEVVKNYSDENKGVYDRIGEGSKWVLGQEESAVFLEDDNLPEVSFFRFCEEMLIKYKNESRVLWVMGTNYLTNNDDGLSYVYTRHTMPCGWASWSEKFIRYYDGQLDTFQNDYIKKNMSGIYNNASLEKQKDYFIRKTYQALKTPGKRVSWDHQMTFSILSNNLYGIAPSVNLIKNIGVTKESTHGGTTLINPMTKRFCGMNSLDISFPLVSPPVFLPNLEYEKKVGKIIQIPFLYYRAIVLAQTIREKFNLETYSFSKIIFDPIAFLAGLFKSKK